MSLLVRKQLRGTDNLDTPIEAIEPILPYLPHSLWEPAKGRGIMASILRELGKNVIATTSDFLTTPAPKKVEAIITNPPYSIKTQFLKRAYELKLPFAFLLPITALEGIERQRLYAKHGLQVLFLGRRIDFTGKKAPWFAVAWFTWKLGLPKDLMFEKKQ